MNRASKIKASGIKQNQSELISAHLGEAKAGEAASTPLKSHDQIRGLWEYDPEIQLSDAEIKKGA